MKKIFFILVALCAMVSCSKDELKNEQGTEEIAFIAAPLGESNGDTKTTVDVTYDEKTGKALTGKVSWNIGDLVSIYKKGTEGEYGIYKVTAVGSKQEATLTHFSGTKFSDKGTYCATYGDVSSQIYISGTPGSNCPMEAEAETQPTSGTKTICEFYFTNSCGVVAIVANTKENVIEEIRIGKYILAFQTPSKINGTCLIAVPDGESFSSVTFVKSNGQMHKKTISSASVARNKIRRMNTGDYFGDCTYDDMTTNPEVLPGEFKVGNNKYVHFVKGNLCCNAAGDVPIWGFETEQYYGVPSSDDYNSAHVHHFCHNNLYGYKATTNSGINVSKVNWGDKFATPTGYSSIVTLTGIEWNYMLNPSYGKANYTKVYINGQLGVILLPPSFNTATDWNTETMGEAPKAFSVQSSGPIARTLEQFRAIEAKGGVLLMFTGFRNCISGAVTHYPGQPSAAQPNLYYCCNEVDNYLSEVPAGEPKLSGGSAFSAYSVRLAVVIDKTPATTN